MDPYTNESLSPCGTCSRIVKTPEDTFTIWIEVYRDSKGKYHRALPDFLLPYKHYSIQTIESMLDDDDNLYGHSNIPSGSTEYRWNRWMHDFLFKHQVTDSDALLYRLKSKHNHTRTHFLSASGWLAELYFHSFQTTLNFLICDVSV